MCMMYPRLRLLHRLLAKDGAIFISIDNSEYASLKLICDEIMGQSNYVDTVSWFKKASPSNDAQFFSNDIEYILIYAKDKNIWRPYRLPLNKKQRKNYQNPDNDIRGDWNSATYTCNKSSEERPNLYYPIQSLILILAKKYIRTKTLYGNIVKNRLNYICQKTDCIGESLVRIECIGLKHFYLNTKG